MKLQFFCPYCGFAHNAGGAGDLGGLPPTGGDYEWSESDTAKTCINCGEKFSVRLRTDLETGRVIKLCAVPRPKVQNLSWFAFGVVDKNYYGAKKHLAQAISLHKSFEEAQEAERAYQKSYYNYQIFEVCFDGFYLDGEKILERDSSDTVKFHLW